MKNKQHPYYFDWSAVVINIFLHSQVFEIFFEGRMMRNHHLVVVCETVLNLLGSVKQSVSNLSVKQTEVKKGQGIGYRVWRNDVAMMTTQLKEVCCCKV